MRSRIRKRPFLLAAVLVLATLAPPRLALCVGDGGHRALELLSADCCPTVTTAHSRAEELETPTGGCTSDCTDTPVGAAGALKASSPTRDLTVDALSPAQDFALTSAGASGLLLVLAKRDHHGPAGISPPAPRAARSTVQRL